MQILKDAIALHYNLIRQFICFENEGLLKVGLILCYKRISESFDPTCVEIEVGTRDTDIIVMKLAEIQNAYIMTPAELLEYANKSAEMGAKAQEILNKIYGFLETLKAG